MKIEESKVNKLTLTELSSLDPVTVYLEDFRPGQGKILIECCGQAWTSYWGEMGEDVTISQFFCSCHNDYILRKMLKKTRETDFSKIEELAKEKGVDICATNDVELALLFDEMVECFGFAWCMDLPQCNTSDYNYLSRIIDAVKEALGDSASHAATLNKKIISAWWIKK